MTHFEPTVVLNVRPNMRIEMLRQYSDNELLVELRRRGRLARVETESTVTDLSVKDGLPLSLQIEEAWDRFAYKATRLHIKGTPPTGAKVENVRGDNKTVPAFEKGRRVRFAVNYVVDRSHK